MNEWRKTRQQFSETAGCVTAAPSPETAGANTILRTCLKTRGLSMFGTRDAAAWLHCCFRISSFHICICADSLSDLRFTCLTMRQVESVSCLCVMKSCFSHHSICGTSLWLRAMRWADTRWTKNLPKAALHQVTSVRWLQNDSFRWRLLYPDVPRCGPIKNT